MNSNTNPNGEEPRGPGQPRKLVGDTKVAFLRVLELGMSKATACKVVGVSRKTVANEAARDPDFRRDIRAADEKGKALLVKRIHAASVDNWTAAAWLLERQHHQEFGRRSPDTYDTADVVSLALRVAEAARKYIPPDDHDTFLDQVRSALGEAKKARRKRG